MVLYHTILSTVQMGFVFTETHLKHLLSWRQAPWVNFHYPLFVWIDPNSKTSQKYSRNVFTCWLYGVSLIVSEFFSQQHKGSDTST